MLENVLQMIDVSVRSPTAIESIMRIGRNYRRLLADRYINAKGDVYFLPYYTGIH